jgi:4-hydroxyphenylpyruvate dioxygenase
VHPDYNKDMALDIARRGDGTKDVAFTVKDCQAVYDRAVARGAKSIKEPEELTDEDGTVIIATVATFGDAHHTLIERRNYKGVFLPGYKDSKDVFKLADPLESLL